MHLPRRSPPPNPWRRLAAIRHLTVMPGSSARTGNRPMHYYTNVGPVGGPALDRRVPPTIEVLKAPDDAQPIGTALCVGVGDNEIALWRLIVHGAILPDCWI